MDAFEFMDLKLLPNSIRKTLRDILDCANSFPFRFYYDWTTEQVNQVARQMKATKIVELGAGTAPLTRCLATDSPLNLELIPCDLNPDSGAYQELERKHPGRVRPVFESVDFSESRQWPKGTLLVLSATLHHIPSEARFTVLSTLLASADHVLIFESLKKDLASMLYCCFGWIPALLTPLLGVRKAGFFRRIIWCWLIPLAPLMFIWDGWISCLRAWNSSEWESVKKRLAHANDTQLTVQETFFCQSVYIRKN